MMQKLNKTQMLPAPYLMSNSIQNYEWGSRGNNAFIPTLINIEAEGNLPYAELWIGAHPKAPSRVNINGQFYSILELITAHPIEMVGEYVYNKFGCTLPFLFKILSAAEPLSIQVHPDKNQARLLHTLDPKNYPDENHKPEIAISLGHFTALAGFKPFNEIVKVLTDFPELLDLFDNVSIDDLNKLHLSDNEVKKNFIKDLYSKVNELSIKNSRLFKIIDIIEERLNSNSRYSEITDLFSELKKKYGYDTGLFSIFLLNYLELGEGEGLFLNSGLPHVYIKGNIIECMANSDNVIRAGLTGKFKDVKALLETVNYECRKIDTIKSNLKSDAIIYYTAAEEFQVTRWNLSRNSKKYNKTNKRPEILFILDGRITIGWENNQKILKQNFHKGQSVFIPAFLQEYRIQAEDNSIIIRTSIP
jgi:mannose-6-phosphate isomerase